MSEGVDKQIWIDKTGEIEKYFHQIIKEKEDVSFLDDYGLKFLFTFTSKPMYDDEGEEIAGYAKRLGNRERDVYGYDFEICIYKEYWDALPTHKRLRLIHHELKHCRIEWDYDDEIEMEMVGEPAYDKQGRIKIYAEPHDLVIKTFKSEILEYGLDNAKDLDVAIFMSDQLAKHLGSKAVKASETNKSSKSKSTKNSGKIKIKKNNK